MAQALYRKYRPQRFEDLVGQHAIKVTLLSEIEHGRISHAYLFTGPRGVGKTTTARLLAKAANCSNRKSGEPCESCSFCKEITSGRSLDLLEIDAASHTGVDNVRENIIENSRFTPQRAPYKVYIIDEVHMLSTAAFNALLKTLEEPPAHVIFILATTEIHRVPETIISRCQRFDFKRVGIEDLVRRLRWIAESEKVGVNDTILTSIARHAEGSVRDAEVLLGQIVSIGGSTVTDEEASLVIPRSNLLTVIEWFNRLVAGDAAGAIILVNTLIDDGIAIEAFARDAIDFIRTLIIYKVTGSVDQLEALELEQEVLQRLRETVAGTPLMRLNTIIEVLLKKTRDFRYSPIAQLPLELAVLELCEPLETNQSAAQPAPPIPKKPVRPPRTEAPKKSDHMKSERPRDSAPQSAAHAASFESIQRQWSAIMRRVKEANHSLSLSLKVGVPVSFEKGVLTVGFRHTLHADRLKIPEARHAIEDAVSEVLGTRCRLSMTVLKSDDYEKLAPRGTAPADKPGDDTTMKQALELFGGEVVGSDQ
ncbi:MAG: DNA polymerase III subunit gamma/tau [Patescibacteria group bacterium]|nr:DNA polymerase III subunit gamma/tau [Patescibacteria group bacterium]MDD5715285.1 DNA polymerase III subunit gamma/tau [Patescibacteria group bacterium]